MRVSAESAIVQQAPRVARQHRAGQPAGSPPQPVSRPWVAPALAVVVARSACRRPRRARRTTTRRPAASNRPARGLRRVRRCGALARALRADCRFGSAHPWPVAHQARAARSMVPNSTGAEHPWPRFGAARVDNPRRAASRGTCHEPPRRLAARPRDRPAPRPGAPATRDSTRVDDVRIAAVRPLISPALLQDELPMPEATQAAGRARPRAHRGHPGRASTRG